MLLLPEILVFLISFIGLIRSSQVLVDNTVKISRITRLGELAAGFILLSVITNAPEISIAISSIISQNIGISLGNVVGSNMGDLCLIVGTIAIIKTINVGKETMKKLFTMLFFSCAIPLVLLYLTNVGKIVGVILLSIFVYFCYYSSKKKVTLEQKKQFVWQARLSKIILISFLAISVVIISSNYLVKSASNIAEILGLSKVIIGASIVSIGSISPEFIIGIVAARKGHMAMALGDVIGSTFTTITLVLGLLLLASPMTSDIEVFSSLVMFLVISSMLIWLFMGKGGIDRIEGIFLVLLYVVFLMTIFGIQTTILQIFK